MDSIEEEPDDIRDLRILIRHINECNSWTLERAAETIEALVHFKRKGGFPDERSEGESREALPRALLARLARTRGKFRTYLGKDEAAEHLNELTGYAKLHELDALNSSNNVSVYARRARECIQQNLKTAFPSDCEQDQRRRTLLSGLLAWTALLLLEEEVRASIAEMDADSGESPTSKTGEPTGPTARITDAGASSPETQTTATRHGEPVANDSATDPGRRHDGEGRGMSMDRPVRSNELNGPVAIHPAVIFRSPSMLRCIAPPSLQS